MSETEPLLVTIGDIGFSENWVVTPLGTAPIAGTELVVTDLTTTVSRTPTWALVVAIAGVFFFFLSLLFLLVRDRETTGYLQIVVRNGDLFHTTMIPISSELGLAEAQDRAIYARRLIAAAA